MIKNSILTIILLVLFSNLIEAEPREIKLGKLGLEYSEHPNDYKKYIGDTVVYLKPVDINNDDGKFTGKFGKEYVIENIKISALYSGATTYIITLVLKEVGGKTKVNWKFKSGFAYDVSPYGTIPVLRMSEYNKIKSNCIGKKVTTTTKDNKEITYECVEVSCDKEADNNDYNYILPTYIMRRVGTDEYKKICVFNTEDGYFETSLSKVEKPSDGSNRYGETQIIEDKGITKYSFSDNIITMICLLDKTGFSFSLKNESSNSIKINWDEAVYVDYSGNTSRIMHSGVKYSQMSESQPATTVIKGATLNDIIIPIDKVRYSSIINDWITDSLFPSNQENGLVRIMVPIQIKETINEYIFIFNLNWIYRNPELIGNKLFKIQ